MESVMQFNVSSQMQPSRGSQREWQSYVVDMHDAAPIVYILRTR